MQIYINTSILATAQDLTLIKNLYLQMEDMEKNVIIFGANMNSSVYVDNKGKES